MPVPTITVPSTIAAADAIAFENTVSER